MSSGQQGSAYSAAGQALGYLVQVDYALLLALRRRDEPDFAVSIETLDDIAFHDAETGDPTEKWQSKHTVSTSRTLGDASPDLWKTLHNWISEPGASDVKLTLLSVADAGPAAQKLRPASGERDVEAARRALERIARESTNKSNKLYYKEFLAFSEAERQALLDRVEIVDGAVGAGDLPAAFDAATRLSTRPQRRPALVSRLRAWWHQRALDHLDAVARGERDVITSADIEGKLLDIADSLRDDELPIDISDVPRPGPEETRDSDRIFVEQLRLIALADERIRKAIFDHNRAYAQRSTWMRDRLVDIGELGDYDDELIEVWERYFLPVSRDGESADPVATARERYVRLDRDELPALRSGLRRGWIARGSLQMIADRLEIGWHPEWSPRLAHRLDEVRDAVGQGRAG